MRSAIRMLACMVLLSLAAGCSSSAQNQGVPGDVKNFVTQYVAALNAKDVGRLRSSYYPKSLACITPKNNDYYDEAIGVHVRDPIPADYTFSVLPVNEENLKAFDGMVRFPVKPAQELHIEYQQGEDLGSVVVWLVQENGRWFDDQPCATEQTLKQFRDEAVARKQRATEHKALAAEIQEPLRSELLAMLREHKTVSATKRYQEASGKDYETCMFVIYELEPEARQGAAQ